MANRKLAKGWGQILGVATLLLTACAGVSTQVAFPTDPPSEITLRGSLLKPDGPGPFPAVILLHSIGGLTHDAHLPAYQSQWARQGFVSLVVDSYGPRGRTTQMQYEPEIGRRRLFDAYGAIRYLRSLPQVDPNRIAVIGFSDGGRVALGVAGGLFPGEPLPRAAVGYYPACGAPLDIGVLKIPFLAHVAEFDDWHPWATVRCEALFRLLTFTRAPLEVHRYRALHGFDNPRYTSVVRTPLGSLQYDGSTDRLAWERTLNFLRKHLDLK